MNKLAATLAALHMVGYDLVHEGAGYVVRRTGRGGRFFRAVERHGDKYGL